MIFPFFRKKKQILDRDSQLKVVECIKEAEIKTTGEVRVYVETRCAYMDAMDRAREVFFQLGMEKTQERNAIIIYLATEDRQYALFGDKVIYEKAGGPVFWQSASDKLRDSLKKGEITEGLCNCVRELGHALATHFPHDASVNKNELPDEIVFGK